MREADPAALAKRRSRLQELRASSSSSGSAGAGGGGHLASEAAIAFGVSKRESRRRLGPHAASTSASAMRKSQSLDAAGGESYSLASIQSPLWVTLTNARTIEELAQQKL
ncbi:hypothetical protein KR093_007142 [Drosophila rubida]|uniref:Uncharacterized protein n=1 Tax=Drosophila rubida TaxID=30044 RepID=A0AAD4PS01_9MUSC|nr:hypothetical protein KR093_007142 [Drosophila rubida]